MSICPSCLLPVLPPSSSVLLSSSSLYHFDHFLCFHCQVPLSDSLYYEKDGHFFCFDDFHNLFSPLCRNCSEPIKEQYFSVAGFNYHKDCFVCNECKEKLSAKIYRKNENYYCGSCYQKKARVCKKCDKPIMEVAINAINGYWHADCFVCHRCNKKFEGEEKVKERANDKGAEFQDKAKVPKEENQEREKDKDKSVGEEEDEIVTKEEKKIKEEGEGREGKKEEKEDEESVMDGREIKEKKDSEYEKERIVQERKEKEGEKGRIDKEEGKANEGEKRDKETKKREERKKEDVDSRREDGFCSYTVKDDKLFHFECYKEEFFERCHVCNKFCENEYYQTEGKAVHEGCLEIFKKWKMSSKEKEELNKKETVKNLDEIRLEILTNTTEEKKEENPGEKVDIKIAKMNEIKKEIDRIKEEQLNEKRKKREMKEKKEEELYLKQQIQSDSLKINMTECSKFFTYQDLIQNIGISEIDILRKESYLSDQEFFEVFRMTKDQFYSLPKWRQTDLKKKMKLF